MMRKALAILAGATLALSASSAEVKPQWVSLFNGKDLTGWLWKPGTPTGKATELLTKDGEWFAYRIRAVGTHIQFWINDKLVMTHDDAEYKTGHFAIQGHNPGMKVEAKELYYLDLTGLR